MMYLNKKCIIQRGVISKPSISIFINLQRKLRSKPPRTSTQNFASNLKLPLHSTVRYIPLQQ